MADNVTTQSSTLATIPASTKISTDEDATNGHVQRVKLAQSADGVSTHIQADSDGLLVNLGTNNDVTVSGTVDLGATDNAVLDQIEVNTSYGDNTGAGTETGALRVTIANDSTGLISVDDNGSTLSVDDGGGSLTVDGTVSVSGAVDTELTTADLDTGAGTDTRAVVGLVGSASGGGALIPGSATDGLLVNLGTNNDVTVTGTVDLGATDNAVLDQIEVNTSYGDNTGAGTEAGVLRVTIANDSTGLISVDDNGGSLTVDGTVTANLSATDNAVLDSIDTAVNGTLTVDLGVNNDVTIDGSSIVHAEDTVHNTGDAGVMSLAVRKDSGAAIAGTDGDYSPLQVDATGNLRVNVAAGSSSGTEYTEDDAAVANPAGPTPTFVRQDTPATLTSADGDVVAGRATNYGAQFVQVVDSSGNFINTFGGSGGTSHADDAAFTIGSASSITPTGYLADETTPDSVDEGDVGVPRMTLTRKPYAVITDATSENNAAVDGSGHLQVDIAASSATVTVDGSGVTQPVSGTVTANLSATDNAVLDQIEVNTSYGDNTGGGAELGALRVTIANDSTGLISVDDNGGSLTVDGTVTANAGTGPWPVTDNGGSLTIDNAALSVTGTGTESGALRVTIATDSTGVLSVDDNGSTISIDDGAGSITVDGTITASNTAGNVAHDAADSGNPVKTGGKAYNFDGTVPGTAVAENDRANMITDLYGRQYVETAHPRYFNARADYAAAQTNTSLQAAPGAGLKLFITDIIISNGATAGNITLLDGSGGTVIFEIYPAINGGVSTNLRTPIALTANTALVVTSTTVTTHSVMVNGYIAP